MINLEIFLKFYYFCEEQKSGHFLFTYSPDHIKSILQLIFLNKLLNIDDILTVWFKIIFVTLSIST